MPTRRFSGRGLGARLVVTTALVTLALTSVAADAGAASPKTRLVSVRSNGAQGNEGSSSAALSADGRFVAFHSDATDLVANDLNDHTDVFVHDRRTGKTTLVSRRSNGALGDGESSGASISASGRFVSFTSSASNLVGNDTNGTEDVFVHDRETGKTRRVSVRSNGAQGNASSGTSTISPDGRFVAFQSSASNLVGDDTNGANDIFVHDRRTGRTTRVSLRSSGAQADSGSGSPRLSANGRFVAFSSSASTLVKNDTNGFGDVFVHDRRTGRTRRVSLRSNGAQGDGNSFSPAISADGRYVAFESAATDLIANDTNATNDVFVHDRRTGSTRRVSVRSNGAEGGQGSFDPDVSASGRHVIFTSDAANLIAVDSNAERDVFVHDRGTGKTTRMSRHTNGTEADDRSFDPRLSGDGRFAAFASDATTLVSGDANAYRDIFVRGPLR